MPMLPSKKKTPITINTIGPANDRGGRGAGGIGALGGGGAWVALAIVHLTRWLLLGRSSGAGRRTGHRRSWSVVVPTSLHQLHNSNYKQNHRPGPVPSRNAIPAFMQVIQQCQYSDRHQDGVTGQTAMTIISRSDGGSVFRKQQNSTADT